MLFEVVGLDCDPLEDGLDNDVDGREKPWLDVVPVCTTFEPSHDES